MGDDPEEGHDVNSQRTDWERKCEKGSGGGRGECLSVSCPPEASGFRESAPGLVR